MEKQNYYGTCECGWQLEPVWFEEKEYSIEHGIVDDTFDGTWRQGKRK